MRSSFHTTINVLEGLLRLERATGGSEEVRKVRLRGEEFLLVRHLFQRKSTSEPVDPDWLRFSFPVQWFYDVSRALDYFCRVGGRPDPRIGEAIDLVRSKRQPDGTWLLDCRHTGNVHFELDAGEGQPSRWNTLRALRVLRWFEGQS
ncbi:MAG TPA: hypothetical protein PJ994_07615 [Tepidiformaceae bacterium]|nr:hypothetical protein [Tepidiformaceae bacterium]